MKIKNWYKLLPLLSLLLVFAKAEAHPYHVSVAEMRYNAKTQALEISLKLFTDDLEKTLSEMAGKPVAINQSPEVKKLIETYLGKTFRIENNVWQARLPRFLGYEAEADAQWIHFEVSLKNENLTKIKIRNQVLLEIFPDQINMVNLEINGKKRTLIFKEGEVLKQLL